MSSTYSSSNNAPRCQRCGASLALKNPRCMNCGYQNTAQLANNAPQQQQSPAAVPWNQQGQQEQTPSPNQPGPRQNGGLLKRYSAQTEQRHSYTPQASFPSASHPQAAPHPIPPRASLSQARQQSGNRNDYAQPSGPLMNNSGYAQNMSQAASPRLSTDLNAPSANFRASSQQLPPPAYAQAPNLLYQRPEQRRQPRVGRIVGALVLLLVIVGGSFLAYTFLFPHKNVQQATNGTASHSSSTTLTKPQGNPLFQDDFMNNTNSWSIQSYPGEFSVALGNGALKLENDNNKLLWELVPGDKQYGDFQLSVDAVLSKGSQDNGYGVYFRSALSQNSSITTFYRFELYGDGSFAVFKGTTDANGTVTTPRLVDYTNSSAIQKQGNPNHITISAKGASLQFIVNGQTLSTVSDATYTSGSVALFVSNLQKAPPGAIATFSHLAIYSAQK